MPVRATLLSRGLIRLFTSYRSACIISLPWNPPFSKFEASAMSGSASSGDSVDDSNPSASLQARTGKKATQTGTGWMPSLLRFFSQPAEGKPKRNREFYENLSLDSKRALYPCGSKYLTLDKIQTWEEFQNGKPRPHFKEPSPYSFAPTLNQKVSLWQGDITRLEIGAIVNAANSSLLGGGGVDGAIHKAAGSSLRDECATLGGCNTGDAKLTSGHRLPAKYILHTVGPMDGNEQKLRNCYTRCLQLTLENGIRSLAFCCIATGVYGYPNKGAAHIALETVRKWLEINADKVDRVIFCVFLNIDYKIYQQLLYYYFPPENPGESEGGGSPSPQNGGEQGSDKEGVPIPEHSASEPASSTLSKSQPGTSESQHRQQQQQPEMKPNMTTSQAARDEIPLEDKKAIAQEMSQEHKEEIAEEMSQKQEELAEEMLQKQEELAEEMSQEHKEELAEEKSQKQEELAEEMSQDKNQVAAGQDGQKVMTSAQTFEEQEKMDIEPSKEEPIEQMTEEQIQEKQQEQSKRPKITTV